jgi:DNA-binding response OmpR family regulator
MEGEGDMSSGRVLVVEDEVLIRMLAVDMLLDLGREADEAGTAAEALELLRMPGADYALVLLDLGLPDKHGDDLVREIRQTHAALPLVVASGEDQTDVSTRLKAFEPICFLGKPFDLDGLKIAIEKVAP